MKFSSEEVGILHSVAMKICIFEPFPAYGKVGVNMIRYELLLKDQIMCFKSFKDQFNPKR